MVAVKCSCNSKNPNCYKCNGWGYLEEGVREVPQDRVLPIIRTIRTKVLRTKIISSASSKKVRSKMCNKNNWIECPQCGCEIQKDEMRAHFLKNHKGWSWID